jgi:hypothetical protein
MQDPQLTKSGISDCVEHSKTFPKVDVVLCSQLLRAMQTALYTCPNRFVRVVPHLNELGTGMDNVPFEKTKQMQILGDKARWVLYSDETHEENLVIFIKKHIVPKISKRDCIHIALFTHSRFIAKHCNINMRDVPNNSVITKTYKI